MSRDYVAYEESTPWPLWVVLIIVAGFLVPAILLAREALGASAGGDAAERVLVLALLPLGPAIVWLLFGRLRVRVTRTSLLLTFGYLPLIQKLVSFADVQELEPVRYSPLAEFGGWGIRFGLRGKRAWTMRGNRAVRLKLRDGKLLYVGSQNAERLAAEIRSAGGGRWREENVER